MNRGGYKERGGEECAKKKGEVHTLLVRWCWYFFLWGLLVFSVVGMSSSTRKCGSFKGVLFSGGLVRSFGVWGCFQLFQHLVQYVMVPSVIVISPSLMGLWHLSQNNFSSTFFIIFFRIPFGRGVC